MNKQKNSPDTTVRGGRAKHQSKIKSKGNNNFNLKPKTRLHNIISEFVKGNNLNKFEAERLGDHCLNTTISNIFIRFCIRAKRKNEKVKTRFGNYTTVKRYWFSDDDIAKIKPLLSEVGR